MPKAIQASLTGGEISPLLHSRIDLSKYQDGVALALNWFVHAQGGMSTRAGTKLAGYVEDDTKSYRMIPFRFNTEQAYALIFGEQTMRVIRNGALILDPSGNTITGITQANPGVVTTSASHGYSNGDRVYLSTIVGMTELNGRWVTIADASGNSFSIGVNTTSYTAYASAGTVDTAYQIATPYDDADLFDIKFTQDADIMTFTHPDYQTRELARTDHDAWALSIKTIAADVEIPNIASDFTLGGSTTVTAQRRYRYAMTAVVDGIESLKSGVAENITAFGSALANITAITQANPCRVTLDAAPTEGDSYYISGITPSAHPLNGRIVVAIDVSGNTFTPYRYDHEETAYDSTDWVAWTSGGAISNATVSTNVALGTTYYAEISWQAMTADYFNMYKEDPPLSGIWGWIGEADGSKTSFRDYNVGPDLAVTPPLNTDPFAAGTENPLCVEYHQQRLFFGGTTNDPEIINASRSAQYNNFDVSRPRRDDDALAFRVKTREVNEVRHMVSIGDLLVLTAGAEYLLKGDQNGTLTPGSTIPFKQGAWGCSQNPPIVIGDTVLFVEIGSQRVRDLAYTFDADKFTGNDLTIMAEHLFENKTIVDWCYCKRPFKLIWVVMSDGSLLSLAYLKEHQVWGWTQHATDGEVESVCSVPEGNEDILYLMVKRTINGSTVRYAERMRERFFADIEDAYHVDCGGTYQSDAYNITGITATDPVVIDTSGNHGLVDGDKVRITGVVDAADDRATDDDSDFDTETSFQLLNNRYFTVTDASGNQLSLLNEDGTDLITTSWSGGIIEKAVTTIYGLDFLDGETVTALCDGSVVEDLTVSNGQVTVPNECTVAHIGLGYTCDIKTLPVQIGQEILHGYLKSIREVILRVKDSRGLAAGPKINRLTDIRERTPQMVYDSIPALTKEQRVKLKAGWSEKGDFFIRQRYPLPSTILAIVPEVDVG